MEENRLEELCPCGSGKKYKIAGINRFSFKTGVKPLTGILKFFSNE